jgi:dipeptidyl aminopeptidase/acylaminoacyl peptidase
MDELGVVDPHWGDDGTLMFPTQDGLYYIPSEGGPPVQLSVGGLGPFVLPDGSGAVFQALAGGLHFVDIAADSSWELHPEGTHPTYVEPGFILYVAPSNDLFALPFDLERHQVTGPPVRVLDRVASAGFFHRGYSVSRAGTLVHHKGEGFASWVPTLVIVRDFQGRADTLPLPPGSQRVVRFSPSGRAIAYEVVSDAPSHDIYTFDLVTGANQQITFESDNDDPLWSPDGTRLLFNYQGDGTEAEDLWIKPADNSADAEQVLGLPGNQVPVAWIDDDRFVFVSGEAGNDDLYVYSFSSGGQPEPYLQAPWQEFDLALSPDGDLAAVATTETGSQEIWLREFPVPEGKWRVSFGGGRDPRWSPDGRTLYFARYGRADTLFSVRVDRDPAVVVHDAEVVFAAPAIDRWDLHPDGERFLVVVPTPSVGANQVAEADDRYLVVLNWFEELKERVGN